MKRKKLTVKLTPEERDIWQSDRPYWNSAV
nr:MAG TPA: hypothetical protein [Bacteriophage sp.]